VQLSGRQEYPAKFAEPVFTDLRATDIPDVVRKAKPAVAEKITTDARGNVASSRNSEDWIHFVTGDDQEFHLDGPTKPGFPKTLDCHGDLRNLRGRPL
jgi:hypothetical protein